MHYKKIQVMILIYAKIILLVISCYDKYILKLIYWNFVNEYQNIIDILKNINFYTWISNNIFDGRISYFKNQL